MSECHKKVEQQVREWHEALTGVFEIMERLDDVLDINPESPLNAAIFKLIGSYNRALGWSNGIDGWLEWWWTECRMGENPMRAGLPGGELTLISNIDDLVKLIIDDLKQTQQ